MKKVFAITIIVIHTILLSLYVINPSSIYLHHKIIPHQPKMRNILYIIRSYPENFKTKLAEQASAWIEDVACDSCILVTSSMNLGPARKSDGNKMMAQNIKDQLANCLPQGIKRTQVLFSDCPKGHDTEPACTEANALLYAFYENQIKFDWVFVVDDDVLVFPAELSKVLETRDRLCLWHSWMLSGHFEKQARK